MKSNYSFLVCADIRYLPEVIAELNSLDYVGNTSDVHFYGYQIPKEVQEQFILLNYQVIFHEITDDEISASHGLSEVVCRKRYFFANEIGQDYKAICVLDADMIFTRNPVHFFEIAEKTGFVLGASKEQNKVYDDPHYIWKGKWIIEKGYYNHVDLCNCPLFINIEIWGKALVKSYQIFIDGFPDDNFKGPDMCAMNICLIEAGSVDKTIVMPGIQWLGTNEQLLKPYIRAVNDRGLIKTECGIPVFSYHGQYYHKKWRDCQLDNRHNCAHGYLKTTECPDSMARGAMGLLYGNFLIMLDHKIKIPKLNYRHPELPYEE